MRQALARSKVLYLVVPKTGLAWKLGSKPAYEKSTSHDFTLKYEAALTTQSCPIYSSIIK
jgi:hypothetical protein